jgi:hypothetical protein
LIDALFDLTPEIRYVAVYDDGDLSMRQRPGIGQASAAESDRYEELLANPTILKLTTQRGDIDRGGLRYVVARYGNLYQLVVPQPACTSRLHSSHGPDPSPMLRAS